MTVGFSFKYIKLYFYGMIGLEHESQIVMEEICQECKGKRKIKVYRNDLEDFEEIECPKCSNQNSNKE